MKLEVITRVGAVVKDLEILEITLPGKEMGQFGILPGHKALIAALDVGTMVITTQQGEDWYTVSSGFVEVLGDLVRVLTQACDKADEIDLDQAKAELEKAEAELGQVPVDEADHYHVVMDQIKLARARIAVASRGKA